MTSVDETRHKKKSGPTIFFRILVETGCDALETAVRRRANTRREDEDEKREGQLLFSFPAKEESSGSWTRITDRYMASQPPTNLLVGSLQAPYLPDLVFNDSLFQVQLRLGYLVLTAVQTADRRLQYSTQYSAQVQRRRADTRDIGKKLKHGK